jgi:hypothetical protein
MIASARNMTVVAEGQYNTVGLPKGSLTPATITAMVGFSKGEGLQIHPDVTAAATKLQQVYLTNPSLGASANAAASSLLTTANNMMAGGPGGFMQKFNQARAHIGDAIELKKVTAFCSNVNLKSFGSGIEKISDLADQGLTSSLGDLSKVGDCMSATGGMFNMSDMASFGKSAGLFKQLKSSKMGNSTGITSMLKKVGVDPDDIDNPVYKDRIDLAMSKINDPTVLNAVADQFNVSPLGGLPDVSTKNLTETLKSTAGANPFAGLPSAGTNNSLDSGATSVIGGSQTTYNVNSPPPASLQPAADSLKAFAGTLIASRQQEPSATPTGWANNNDKAAFGATAKPKVDPDIIKKIEELFQTVINGSKEYVDAGIDIVSQYMSIDPKAADADAHLATVRSNLKTQYQNRLNDLATKMFADANEAGRLINTLPYSTDAQKIDRNTYVAQRDGPIENLLKLVDITNKNVTAARNEISGKISAAKGGLSVTTT